MKENGIPSKEFLFEDAHISEIKEEINRWNKEFREI